MYMYMYTYIHTYINTYIHAYIHTYIHIPTNMYTYPVNVLENSCISLSKYTHKNTIYICAYIDTSSESPKST